MVSYMVRLLQCTPYAAAFKDDGKGIGSVDCISQAADEHIQYFCNITCSLAAALIIYKFLN